MKPQLSWMSEWTCRVALSVLFGCGLSACGEDAQQGASERSVLLVAKGREDFGAVFAAGGDVGTATVWASDPRGERGRRCEFRLDASSLAVACEDYCDGARCPRNVARAVDLQNPADDSGHCFVLGVDSAGYVSLDCDRQIKQLPLPPSLLGADSADWRVAANQGVSPLLAVSAPRAGKVWFYATMFEAPVEIDPGTGVLPAGFGADVALLRFGQDRFHSRLIAAAAPDAGQVWLLRTAFPAIEAPFRVGCLGERPGFGKHVASGDLDGDGLTDLLIADDEFVTAFSGAALATVSAEQAKPGCSLAALPEGAILASVSCASGGLTSGCKDAEFGSSMAVADLDGDADGEIIVGAPAMTVSGKRSGAVLVYDAEGEAPHALTESIVSTELPDGARFGASVAVVQARNVDSLVIGAPGSGAIFLAPCFSMTRPELRPRICGGS